MTTTLLQQHAAKPQAVRAITEAVRAAIVATGERFDLQVKAVEFDVWFDVDLGHEPNLLVEVTLADPPKDEGTWPDPALRVIEDAVWDELNRNNGWEALDVTDVWVRFRPEHIDPADLA